MVDKLLCFGGALYFRNKAGQTALHIAASRGAKNTIRLLCRVRVVCRATCAAVELWVRGPRPASMLRCKRLSCQRCVHWTSTLHFCRRAQSCVLFHPIPSPSRRAPVDVCQFDAELGFVKVGAVTTHPSWEAQCPSILSCSRGPPCGGGGGGGGERLWRCPFVRVIRLIA